MLKHYLTRAFASATGGAMLGQRIEISAGGEVNLDETAPIASNTLVALTLDVSQIKSLFIQADQDLTLKTNNSGSPVNTITLAANVPFLWITGDAPLRDTAGTAIITDITALYVTNASASAATLQLRCLVDPTV